VKKKQAKAPRQFLSDRVIAVVAPSDFQSHFEKDPEGAEIQDFLNRALEAANAASNRERTNRRKGSDIAQRSKRRPRKAGISDAPAVIELSLPAIAAQSAQRRRAARGSKK
jgi:hypothetical protein